MIKKIKNTVQKIILSISKFALFPMGVRRCLLRAGGGKVPASTIVCSGVEFKNANISIGEDVLINKNCHLYTSGLNSLEDWITIGDHTQLAFDVKITTATHEIGSSLKRSGKCVSKSVNIGRGCWIGMGAIILPGISIGDGCVIGAGSVVNKDCEADCLYAGNPAKRIRRLD